MMNNNVIIVNYVGKNEEGTNTPDYSRYNDIINELFNHYSDKNNQINLMVNGKMILNCKIKGVSVHNGNASIEFTKSNETSINLEFDKYYSRFNPDTLTALKNCWLPLEAFIEITDDIIHEVHTPVKENHKCNCNCKKNSNKVSMDYIKDKYKKKLEKEAEKKFNNKKLEEIPINCRIEMLAESGKIPKPLRDEILNPKSTTSGIYFIKSSRQEGLYLYDCIKAETILFKNISTDDILTVNISNIENGTYLINLYGACQIGKEDIEALSKNLSNIFKDILGEDVDLKNIFTEWR